MPVMRRKRKRGEKATNDRRSGGMETFAGGAKIAKEKSVDTDT